MNPFGCHLVPLLTIAVLLAPPTGAVEGWKPEESREHAGSALYDHIDGGAEVFLELGFDKVDIRRFHRGEDTIEVEIYRMKDVAAARGVFLMKCGKTKRHPDLADRHTINRHQLMLQRNRFFVLVHNLSGREELVGTLVAFGRWLAGSLPADVQPRALDLLPTQGRVTGSERIVRGPTTLGAIATLGAGDILQLEEGITAVAADYRFERIDRYTRLIAPYGSKQKARSVLAHMAMHLDPYLTVLHSADDRLVFRDHEKKFGDVSVKGDKLVLRIGMTSRPGNP